MSLSIQTQRRLPKIKTGLLKGLNYTKIGTSCGVTERTIDRDVKAWVESGEFETWVKQEWVRLHGLIVKAYPEIAYKELSRILGRMVTRKIEKTVDVEVRSIELSWKHDSSDRDTVHST